MKAYWKRSRDAEASTTTGTVNKMEEGTLQISWWKVIAVAVGRGKQAVT